MLARSTGLSQWDGPRELDTKTLHAWLTCFQLSCWTLPLLSVSQSRTLDAVNLPVTARSYQLPVQTMVGTARWRGERWEIDCWSCVRFWQKLQGKMVRNLAAGSLHLYAWYFHTTSLNSQRQVEKIPSLKTTWEIRLSIQKYMHRALEDGFRDIYQLWKKLWLNLNSHTYYFTYALHVRTSLLMGRTHFRVCSAIVGHYWDLKINF